MICAHRLRILFPLDSTSKAIESIDRSKRIAFASFGFEQEHTELMIFEQRVSMDNCIFFGERYKAF